MTGFCAYGHPRDSKLLRHGLTLVEMMVAIALSALLLAAMTGVLSGIAKQNRLVERYDRAVWPSRFMELLRRDLIASDQLWTEDGTIWMHTDAPAYQSGSRSRRRIGYSCTQGAGSTLERIDDESAAPLALDVSRIALERLDASGLPQPLPPTPGPVPTQVRVWVWQTGQSEPVLLRDLVVR